MYEWERQRRAKGNTEKREKCVKNCIVWQSSMGNICVCFSGGEKNRWLFFICFFLTLARNWLYSVCFHTIRARARSNLSNNINSHELTTFSLFISFHFIQYSMDCVCIFHLRYFSVLYWFFSLSLSSWDFGLFVESLAVLLSVVDPQYALMVQQKLTMFVHTLEQLNTIYTLAACRSQKLHTHRKTFNRKQLFIATIALTYRYV